MKKIKESWYNIKVMKKIRRRWRRLTRVNHALLSGPARSRLIYFQLKDDFGEEEVFLIKKEVINKVEDLPRRCPPCCWSWAAWASPTTPPRPQPPQSWTSLKYLKKFWNIPLIKKLPANKYQKIIIGKGRSHEGKLLFFWILSKWGGGHTQFFQVHFWSINSRVYFLQNANDLKFKLI